MTTETQNSLNDDFVPYEQALALKALGYDKQCFKKSVHKKKCDNKDEKGNCPLHNIFCGYPDCEIDKTIEQIGIPLWQQAFRFFEEEHSIFIDRRIATSANEILGIDYYLKSWKFRPIIIKFENPYDDLDEQKAQIACLKKLIEIVKIIKQEKTIRAKTPADYDQKIHVVTKFKRENYPSFYERQEDGFYRYQEHSAEGSIGYTEGALLALSNVEVVEFKNK